MLVVTGSTGHLGRLVAGEIASRGLEQRLLVRDPSRATGEDPLTVAAIVAQLAGRMPLHHP